MVIKLGGLDSEATVPFNRCQYLLDVSKIRKLSAPKPEKKSPKNQRVEKIRESVPPTKVVVPPLGF